MDISLTPEFERFVQERIKAGEYRTPTDVVQDGLSLLKTREEEDRRREELLRQKLAVSLAESDRGETVPFDESTLEEIRTEGRKRLEAQRNGRT